VRPKKKKKKKKKKKIKKILYNTTLYSSFFVFFSDAPSPCAQREISFVAVITKINNIVVSVFNDVRV
jgi:hypothetical protein